MRGLWFGILLLTVSAANAGPVLFPSRSTLFGPDDRDSEGLSRSYPQGPSLTRRPVGLDGLANRLGITGDRLNFYEFRDQQGTDRESRLTVGVGGKGLMLKLVW